MLTITVPGTELYDEESGEFSTVGEFVLELEHSLISLSKWESKFKKPFLASTEKTAEEIAAYLMLMILTPVYPSDILVRMSRENISQINDYIESPESATTFGEMPRTPGRGETITAELIYYWMVTFNIPFVCETWHLNRLFALIRICNIKQGKPKKMTRGQIAQRNRDLNAKRRAELRSAG
jgi:hypothetical protein